MANNSMSWIQALRVYLQRPVMGMVFLGFSAGLPFLLVFSTLTLWLRDVEISRTAIGFFAWVGITYSIKVIWAPVIDRLKLPWLGSLLGQRRSWILCGQIGIAAGLLAMSAIDPTKNLLAIAVIAVLVAFSSATQDIAIDAFRIESAPEDIQGAMSAAYILGYRVATLVAGAGALYIADGFDWSTSYVVMACCMLAGIGAILWLPEPAHIQDRLSREVETAMIQELLGEQVANKSRSQFRHWVVVAVVCPFVEFFKRNGRFALFLLLLISVFRISDITMGVMANPFYHDLGYSKSEIATVAKFFGFFMTIAGSAICGVMVVKWGILKPMLLGAILVAATNLLFALMAQVGIADITWLAIVISADNLSAGIATVAFIAYLSSLTNRSYTATQYALFSSLMTLPGKFLSGFSGLVVDSTGYATFFVIAACLGVPAILMVGYLLGRERRAISA